MHYDARLYSTLGASFRPHPNPSTVCAYVLWALVGRASPHDLFRRAGTLALPREIPHSPTRATKASRTRSTGARQDRGKRPGCHCEPAEGWRGNLGPQTHPFAFGNPLNPWPSRRLLRRRMPPRNDILLNPDPPLSCRAPRSTCPRKVGCRMGPEPLKCTTRPVDGTPYCLRIRCNACSIWTQQAGLSLDCALSWSV